MQQLMTMTSNQTMTSKELVEVINAIRKEEGNDTEIQHKEVLRRIRSFDQILGQRDSTPSDYIDSQGKTQPMLLLSKRASMLAVSSESPRINLAIIDRWQQLEMQARPLTYIESLELLLASEKEKEALRIENLKTTVALDHKKDITNEGNDYFTIASVKPLNQGIKLSGSKLTQESYDQELLPKQLFGMYGVNTPNAYHKEVWEAVYPEIILPE